MKISDIANFVPHTTVAPDNNPIRDAITDKRQGSKKAALIVALKSKKKTSNPESDQLPQPEMGENMKDESTAAVT